MLKVFYTLLRSVFGQIVVEAVRNLLLSFKDNPDYLDKLAEVIRKKVIEVEGRFSGPGSGDKKYMEVFQFAVEWSATVGLKVAERTINMLIETALASLPPKP